MKFIKKLILLARRVVLGVKARISPTNKPIFVKTAACDGLRLHLGAGPINLQGWVSIDARNAPHIHLQTSSFELDEFADGSLAEIYMCHVLEHFSFQECEQLLKNFAKKLKVGGVLRISVPDFDKLVSAYHANNNNLDIIKYALMGGQDYEYNFHKSLFNFALLSDLMQKCGYNSPQSWTTEADFGRDIGDWSNKSFVTPSGDFPVSLNLKATIGQR